MESLTQSRFASALTFLAGVWVATSPAYITMSTAAQTNTIIVGVVIALAGLVQMFWTNVLPSGLGMLAAVYLFVSAFVYNISTADRWNLLIAAVVTFLLTSWDGAEISDVRTHRREHMAR
jgi:hypothetical protein